MLLEWPEYGCAHEYPDDWELGGALGGDPRADPRWMPTTYTVLDEKLNRIMMTQTPICDHEILQFMRNAPSPVYVLAERPDGTPEMILTPGGEGDDEDSNGGSEAIPEE